MGPYNPILNKANWTGTLQALYDLDVKRNIVVLFGQTLRISSDLNPISHGGNLTLF